MDYGCGKYEIIVLNRKWFLIKINDQLNKDVNILRDNYLLIKAVYHIWRCVISLFWCFSPILMLICLLCCLKFCLVFYMYLASFGSFLWHFSKKLICSKKLIQTWFCIFKAEPKQAKTIAYLFLIKTQIVILFPKVLIHEAPSIGNLTLRQFQSIDLLWFVISE